MDPALFWKWPGQSDIGNCAVCNKPTKVRCADCKIVYYCTRFHQIKHWKSNHKKNCGVIALAEDPVIGRHYIAKRIIEPGEIVLCETPLLVTLSTVNAKNLHCSNCYTILNSINHKICNKCEWWPLCSKCIDHGAECEFTIKYGKFKDLPDGGEPIRQQKILQNNIMGVIRVLALREKKPIVYRKILKYKDHESKWRNIPNNVGDIYVAKLIKYYFNVENEDELVMAKITRILHSNDYGYKDGISGIAEKAVFFEQSCLPNCAFTISDKIKGTFLAWALKPIVPGENVSISYCDPTDGTMIRQQRLLSTRFLECKCPRCIDPTEYGMMFNAIKCIQKECKGHMLPPSFALQDEKHLDFICIECNSVFAWDSVEEMQKNIGVHLSTIDDNDVNGYRNFIENHAKFLHQNHFHMIKAKLKLANVIAFNAYCDPNIISVMMDELDAKIKLSEEMADFTELLMPGCTAIRGRLLYGIAVALSIKCNERVKDPIQRSILLIKIKDFYTEVSESLFYERQHSEEGQMARQAIKMFLILGLMR